MVYRNPACLYLGHRRKHHDIDRTSTQPDEENAYNSIPHCTGMFGHANPYNTRSSLDSYLSFQNRCSPLWKRYVQAPLVFGVCRASCFSLKPCCYDI